MSNSEEIHIDPRLFKVIATIVAGLVVIGVYMGINAAYFEPGQWVYFMLSTAGVSLIALRFLFPHKEFLKIGIFLLFVGLAISWFKFEWRKEYINAPVTNPFPFEQYIDSYPSLEKYLVSKLGVGKNWVDFTNQCHDPLLKGADVSPSCLSLEQIKSSYGLDMREILKDHFAKMRKTAKLISNGRMKRKSQLESCLRRKECAVVPMLPAGVDAKAISEESLEHLDTRRTFWEIVDNGVITPRVCKFVGLCILLGELGAVNPNNPKI